MINTRQSEAWGPGEGHQTEVGGNSETEDGARMWETVWREGERRWEPVLWEGCILEDPTECRSLILQIVLFLEISGRGVSVCLVHSHDASFCSDVAFHVVTVNLQHCTEGRS